MSKIVAFTGIILYSVAFTIAVDMLHPAPADAQEGKPLITPAMRARLETIRTRVHTLGDEVITFWKEKGPDPEHGGFYGTLDRTGTPITPTDKGLTQEIRHLWSFSIWYRYREPTPEIKTLCDNLYAFIISHFYDASDGEFYFLVDEDGSPVDTKKDLYAESFAILGLAEYALTFDRKEAAEYALNCFHSVDARFNDEVYHGYDETDEKGPDRAKDTGDIMHLIESFTTLYKVTGDKQVRQRLNEFIDISLNKIIQPEGYCRMFFARDWTPTGSPDILYGHDLQLAWLILQAAEAVDRSTDRALIDRALTTSLYSSDKGFDPELGGYFGMGLPDGIITWASKIWWVQCEAINALWWNYQLTGDTEQLDRLDKTLDWIETSQRDSEYGEWFAGINEDGSTGDENTRGPSYLKSDNKGEIMKSSYHNIRALVFVEKWINDYLN
ncbi:unnamed protein product [marine sediment metagenome]|uniref:N-acylglucosamine 2-epimerase n=1 Tax=marine sediment metagenome TaxID=412755 RepID=X0RM84_9ZZZZ